MFYLPPYYWSMALVQHVASMVAMCSCRARYRPLRNGYVRHAPLAVCPVALQMKEILNVLINSEPYKMMSSRKSINLSIKRVKLVWIIRFLVVFFFCQIENHQAQRNKTNPKFLHLIYIFLPRGNHRSRFPPRKVRNAEEGKWNHIKIMFGKKNCSIPDSPAPFFVLPPPPLFDLFLWDARRHA